MTKFIFILKRVVISFFTVLIVACLTFLFMNMIPGGPFLTEKEPSPAVIAALNEQYGLDKPLVVQLGMYLQKLAKGDMGVSLKKQKDVKVTTIIGDLFPTSAKIGLFALAWAVIVGIALGSVSAYYRGKWPDNILRVVTTMGVALPTFVVATVLLLSLTGTPLKSLISLHMTSWTSYIVPAFTLGLSPMCYIARYTRTAMLDVLGQDYIRTARAKGLKTPKIIFKHALRNGLIPVVTYIGPLVASLLTGSLVVEKVFSIPGLGRYFVESINARDYPLVMGTTIFLATLIVLVNLVVDILYTVIDPRIELAKGGN